MLLLHVSSQSLVFVMFGKKKNVAGVKKCFHLCLKLEIAFYILTITHLNGSM